MGRRRTSKRAVVVAGLLASAPLVNAVALSDFEPRLTELPAQCNAVYVADIPGCVRNDFQAATQVHTCSSACLQGLVQINALVNRDCAGIGVPETSIVGLFLLGQAIQLLCNVAVVTTTTGLPPAAQPTTPSNNPFNTFSSTMTMPISTPSSLPPPRTSSTFSPPPTRTSEGMIGQSPTQATTPLVIPSAQPSSVATTTMTLSPEAEESRRAGTIEGGGGSPFDDVNNGASGVDGRSRWVLGGMLSVMGAAWLLSLR